MPMVEKLRRRIRGWRRHTSAVFAFADRRTLAPSKAMIRMRMRMVPRMKMMRLMNQWWWYLSTWKNDNGGYVIMSLKIQINPNYKIFTLSYIWSSSLYLFSLFHNSRKILERFNSILVNFSCLTILRKHIRKQTEKLQNGNGMHISKEMIHKDWVVGLTSSTYVTEWF